VLVDTTSISWEIRIHSESHVEWSVGHDLLLDLLHTTNTVGRLRRDLVRVVVLIVAFLTASTSARRRWVLGGRARLVLRRSRNVVGTRLEAVRQASLARATIWVITTCDNTGALKPVPSAVPTIATIASVAAEPSVLRGVLDVLA
jgi:hypothetical protein